MEITYLSQEKYDELQNELGQLKKEGRQAVAKRLKHAKELGDLSENAEYQEAREEQSRLEKKISEIEELLRAASIIKKSSGTATVRIGSRVKLEKNGDTFTYNIVGSNEARPTGGMISNESPVGRALLGHKAGDTVSVQTAAGLNTYKIVAIE
ncbi:MAG: Transcription elongation factor GreA [Candidatus Jorgensenbacteria bacterium GW2011_GWA1_48_13]|uniref:Transcription elongation factor GreA n=2 Tax=Candidatus Joergenseniibacteriota TaxID=1752739 RepID=A0A0G1W8W7_9BACT|nr:MAG: Transcription elongation factor GreA [Candidatus Jorgensenbacteria bacterium GW2011_GWA1_48_13]KKU98932.1 MAG: Transcription elongation factor GreA [Candidatus Jorgensenbacteria bacterium GW2011_GWC1_48_8]KKW15163.1 MAG: Transcription elongation factor GreA [Candidatus Jorgensenbacteria bacterium GW2011_GWB1_50_10]